MKTEIYWPTGQVDFIFFPALLIIACRTGVIFCISQGNEGQSEASAKRELRARGGSLKNLVYPHTIVLVQAVPAFKYERGHLIGYFKTRDPRMFFQDVTARRNTITYSDLNQ